MKKGDDDYCKIDNETEARENFINEATAYLIQADSSENTSPSTETLPEPRRLEVWFDQVLGSGGLVSDEVLFDGLIFFQCLLKANEINFIFKATRQFRPGLDFKAPLIQLIIFNKLEYRHFKLFHASITISNENKIALSATLLCALIRWEGTKPETITALLESLCLISKCHKVHLLPTSFLEYCFKLICLWKPHLIRKYFKEWFIFPNVVGWKYILQKFFNTLEHVHDRQGAKEVLSHLLILIEDSLFELENSYSPTSHKTIADLILNYYLVSEAWEKVLPWITHIVSVDRCPSSFYLNQVICSMCNPSWGLEAYQIFEIVIQKFPNIDPRCHVSAINALIESKHPPETVRPAVEKVFRKFLELRKHLQENSRKFGIQDDPFSYSTYASVYSVLLKYIVCTRQIELIPEILGYFQLYHNPPIPWCPVTFHMLIREESYNHRLENSEKLLSQMIELRYKPTPRIFHFIISGYIEIGFYRDASLHLDAMKNIHGLDPDPETLALIESLKKPRISQRSN